MADPKRCAEILYKHFAEITTEQFLENLKRSSPELFEEDNEIAEISPAETNESSSDGQKFLTPVELDRLREQERQRAKEAIAQLEQERTLREQEQQRYQALIDKLREQGIDPEQL